MEKFAQPEPARTASPPIAALRNRDVGGSTSFVKPTSETPDLATTFCPDKAVKLFSAEQVFVFAGSHPEHHAIIVPGSPQPPPKSCPKSEWSCTRLGHHPSCVRVLFHHHDQWAQVTRGYKQLSKASRKLTASLSGLAWTPVAGKSWKPVDTQSSIRPFSVAEPTRSDAVDSPSSRNGRRWATRNSSDHRRRRDTLPASLCEISLVAFAPPELKGSSWPAASY